MQLSRRRIRHHLSISTDVFYFWYWLALGFDTWGRLDNQGRSGAFTRSEGASVMIGNRSMWSAAYQHSNAWASFSEATDKVQKHHTCHQPSQRLVCCQQESSASSAKPSKSGHAFSDDDGFRTHSLEECFDHPTFHMIRLRWKAAQKPYAEQCRAPSKLWRAGNAFSVRGSLTSREQIRQRCARSLLLCEFARRPLGMSSVVPTALEVACACKLKLCLRENSPPGRKRTGHKTIQRG